MPVETPEDRAIFFDPRDFGEESGALYAPRSGEMPYRVEGIFDMPASEFNPNRWPGHAYQMQEGAAFVMTGPTFHCLSADLKNGGKPRDRLRIGAAAWVVVKAMPDGTGMVTLHLNDADDDPEELNS